jgi:hypothetical protein
MIHTQRLANRFISRYRYPDKCFLLTGPRHGAEPTSYQETLAGPCRGASQILIPLANEWLNKGALRAGKKANGEEGPLRAARHGHLRQASSLAEHPPCLAHCAPPVHPISVRGTGRHGLAPHQTLLTSALPRRSKEDSRFKLIGFFNHSMRIGEMDCGFFCFYRIYSAPHRFDRHFSRGNVSSDDEWTVVVRQVPVKFYAA